MKCTCGAKSGQQYAQVVSHFSHRTSVSNGDIGGCYTAVLFKVLQKDDNILGLL